MVPMDCIVPWAVYQAMKPAFPCQEEKCCYLKVIIIVVVVVV